MAGTQLRLYTNEKSRGSFVDWYLKELGLKYNTVSLDLSNQEHKADAYLKVNPYGKVPALQDGTLTLTESGAILQYIMEKYDKNVQTLEDRAMVANWVFFAYTSLAEVVFNKDKQGAPLEAMLKVLDGELAGRTFLVGESVSAADVALASHLLFFRVFMPQVDLGDWPAVAAYTKRMGERPACAATIVRATDMHMEAKK